MESRDQYVERRSALDTPLGALVRQSPAGCRHTAREILQQPWAWRATAEAVLAGAAEIRRFLEGMTRVVFTGAGSSAYAGAALVPLFRSCGWDAAAVPTTDLLLNRAEARFTEPRRAVLVSLARSGDSPESTGTVDRVLRDFPETRHLILTCNPHGALARKYGGRANILTVTLPPETNDESLVMTSSFSSLIVAGQCVAELDRREAYLAMLDTLCAAGERALDRAGEADTLANRQPERVCVLAPRGLLGAAREAALKVLETTAGRVAGIAETFLGLRHGPMVFVNGRTAVLYSQSADQATRRYEDDLLGELRAKGLGLAIVDLGARDIPEIHRAPVFILWPQMLAMFLALRLGLAPDNPSAGGVINRVVQGVKIYDS